MACTQCEGIETQFSAAEARRKLAQFRRRGPDKTTRLLIEALRSELRGREQGTVRLLDVGAGIGAIHHELLDGGVSRAIHVDASTAHMDAARSEAARRGHSERVEFVYGDFVSLAGEIPSAEIVTLDRVICCYPDMERLVRLSASKARLAYGAVYPREVWWMRVAIAGLNALQRIKRSSFRVFLHAPAAIDAALRAAGLERRSARETVGWQVVVYGRRSDAAVPAD